METADLIWHNGELVAWEDATVHVLTHGLHYGTGVFEGERAYETPEGPAIFRHQDHLKRLFASAELYYMPIPYTLEELRSATHELIAANGLPACYIRPIVYRGYGQMGLNPLDCEVSVSIAVWPWGAYLGADSATRGVRAKVSSWRRISSDSLIPHAKASGQYLNSVLAKIESVKGGYEESILLDSRGFVSEGTGENIFVVRDGVILTPPQTAGILDGINRKSIIQIARDLGYEIVERDLARAELYLADEVFMSGTAAELVPVREIDDHQIGEGVSGAVTRAVQTVFLDALHGRTARYREWLDVVKVPSRSSPMSARIELYDTTLRDGMQGEGMSLSAGEKLRVAHRLDELGLDLIEAGFPSSNPKELELFGLLAGESFHHAQICAFGMTRRRGMAAGADPALRVIAECFAPVCTLVGKTWGLHLEKVVKVDRDENLRMIAESVAFLAAQGKRVIYDAEHFFDGYTDDRAYALRCLRAAVEAGAETVVCCDTNGGTLPHVIGAAMTEVVGELGSVARVGIHTHDDAGCGVANALAAVMAGATHVQGTMNGYGERCGNANLISIIPNLQLKLGYECLTDTQLGSLTPTAHYIAELLNFTPDPDAPYVGRNAFAHKGGMHVAGVTADPATFEHIVPEVVGNHREMLISELSGKGTVQSRAREAGMELDDQAAAHVVERVKELEHRGYHYEAAGGSFELLLRKETGEYEPLFRLESWRSIVEKRADGRVETEATIKIWVGGERYVRTAEGNGPVHALDKALREALVEIYPHLRDIELVNFKVRILDETKGTDAVTRVLLDVSDGERVWGSIGVSENVIEASWEALVDSLEFGMQPPSRARLSGGAAVAPPSS